MAIIRPFRGVRYDASKLGGADPSALGEVMAPPYDVVDDQGRSELANRSPWNSIHFILPEGQGDEKYAKGAARFRETVERAMVRDSEPSVYVYHQRFEVEGKTHVRKGLVTLIELTRFGQGPVLAHERTLAGPKIDRLNLMRACEAHLELVFGLFPDPKQTWEGVVEPYLGEPILDTDFEGIHHTMWRVSDAQAIAGLSALLANEKVYIADGHHRYETMCTFRDELEAKGHPRPAFGMMYLSNLDDPGLVVLPTHRLVHGLSKAVDLETVCQQVSPWFNRTTEDLPGDAAAIRARLMKAGSDRAAFGLTVPGSGKLEILTLEESFEPADAGLGDVAPALARLDVVLLHELVLERALGIDKKAQEAKTNLRYYKSTEAAVDVATGKASDDTQDDTQLVCFMNATPVSDVRAVCDSGEVMPQKSTFFYPKIPNGLVFYDLSAGED